MFVVLNDPLDIAMAELAPASNLNVAPAAFAARARRASHVMPGDPVDIRRFPYVESASFRMPPDADPAWGAMRSLGGKRPRT